MTNVCYITACSECARSTVSFIHHTRGEIGLDTIIDVSTELMHVKR